MTADHASEIDPPQTATSPTDAAEWLAAHGDALYRFARLRLGTRELAEDFVQDTFLAALGSRDRFQGRSSTRTWLLAILRRKIVDHYRRSRSVREATEPDPTARRFFRIDGHWLAAPSPWKTPPEILADEEFRAVIDDCLGRLPPSLAEAFVLREREGLEVEAVREVLALSAGGLRVRLHRARLLLRDCLETHWFDDRPPASPRPT